MELQVWMRLLFHASLASSVKRELERPDRIVAGRPAEKGEFAWQVSLQYRGYNSMSHFCGATLINDSWMVTAAHCTIAVSFDRITAVVGALDLSKPAMAYDIEAVYRHAHFVEAIMKNDVALIKIGPSRPKSDPPSRDLNGPRWVKLQLEKELEDERCYISGWGRTSSHGSMPNQLMAAEVEIQSDLSCRAVMSSHSYKIFDSNICAGGKDKDACQGDSGGPLVCCEEDPFNATSCALVGVTSWGIGCATPGIPGVYTEVAYFTGWIKKVQELDARKAGVIGSSKSGVKVVYRADPSYQG